MTYAIILAAGFGSRFVKQPIKPLFVINKKPIFLHSVLTFLKNKNIDKILLVVNKDYENLYKKYLSKNILTCHGDKSFRYQSLINGVSFLEKKYSLNKNDIIITHDAARINVDNEIINQNITISKKYGYATTILPINDSICEINKISKYIDRNNKYLVQTPQTIQYKYWKKIKGNKNTTDLFSYLNLKCKQENIVIGNLKNIKITTIKDLNIL